MADTLVRWNFHVAVWITIVGGILVLYSMGPGDAGAGIFAGRRAAGVAIFSALQLMNWLWWYRHEEGHDAAAVTSLVFVAGIVALLIIPQVTDEPIDLVSISLLSYFAASHGLYAAKGRWLRPRSALDL